MRIWKRGSDRDIRRRRQRLRKLERRRPFESEAERQEYRQIRAQIRAAETAILVACLGAGKRTGRRRYLQLCRRYGHDNIWAAFAESTRSINRGYRIRTRIATRLAVWSRKLSFATERALRWLRPGTPA